MSTTVKWGLITGMVYVFFSLISNMLGLAQPDGSKLIGLAVNTVLMLITFYTIYLGVKEIKEEEKGGYITVGEGFKAGMGIALIASLISFLFTVVYLNFIDPNFVESIKEATEAQWEQGGMSEEQIEKANSFSSFMWSKSFFSLVTIVYILFWGLIKSLVAGSILKKEAPPRVHEDTPTMPTA